MDQATSASDWRETMAQARKALVKSLNDFGCQQTLETLVRLSPKDAVANEFLCLYPKIVSMGDFMARIPVLHRTERKSAKKRRENGKREVRR
jgi:hypothetical protein